jgi:hypothetical protein
MKGEWEGRYKKAFFKIKMACKSGLNVSFKKAGETS